VLFDGWLADRDESSHDQGRADARLDRVRRRRPGRAGPPHGHEERQEIVEVVYLITSDRDADAATLAAWVPRPLGDRKPASLGRDVTYQGDKSLVRTGNASRVMASLRRLAIRLLCLDGHASIAAANRHHARDPQRTLELLQTA
jgi:hypothetical protein